MPHLETLLVFTLAALAMNISPGPSNLYVMSRSLAQGTSAGLVAAAGLATGSLFHVTVTSLGLAVILKYSPLAFLVMKLAGAAYLVFLGAKMLLAKSAPLSPDALMPKKPLGGIFRQSCLVEILNPKTALFFLAFLPQFADPKAGPLAPQLLLLGAIVTVTAIPCDALVAILSGKAADLLKRRPIFQKLQNWISGSVLVGLGATIALSRRD
ncbi:MAG TPA: LysE family translocator [Candidatus Binatia bacterium]|nr:LysE family translocator [Candidatus Binatia bacterium]